MDPHELSTRIAELQVQATDVASTRMTVDPVVAKVLSRVVTYLDIAQGQLESTPIPTQEAPYHREALARLSQACDLLDSLLASMRDHDKVGDGGPALDKAFAVKQFIRLSIIGIADDSYILHLLRLMLAQASRRRGGAAVDYDVIPQWTALYSRQDLDDAISLMARLAAASETKESALDRAVVVLQLLELYRYADREVNIERARAIQQHTYVKHLLGPRNVAMIFAALFVLAAFLSFDALTGGSRNQSEASVLIDAIKAPLLVGLFSWLGGLIGAFYKLRDARDSVLELLNFDRILRSQLILSTLAGLIVWILMATNIISVKSLDLNDPSPFVLAALGFVGGYSEPVFLGLVGRISGLFDS